MERYKLSLKSCGTNYAKVRKAITAGFFDHAAKKDGDAYRTLNDN